MRSWSTASRNRNGTSNGEKCILTRWVGWWEYGVGTTEWVGEGTVLTFSKGSKECRKCDIYKFNILNFSLIVSNECLVSNSKKENMVSFNFSKRSLSVTVAFWLLSESFCNANQMSSSILRSVKKSSPLAKWMNGPIGPDNCWTFSIPPLQHDPLWDMNG